MFMMFSSRFARCAHKQRSVSVDQTWGQCAERQGCSAADCPLQHRFAGAASEREEHRSTSSGLGFPFG